MNWQKVYADLISDRRLKEHLLERGRYEIHHVRPRHLGGSDEPENLIRLSLQDHLFAHLLLGRIHGGHLAQCYFRMSGLKKYRGGRRIRKRFESVRRLAREGLRECTLSQFKDPVKRDRHQKATIEALADPVVKKKMRDAKIGKPHSVVQVEKQRQAALRQMEEDPEGWARFCAARSNSRRGTKCSPEAVANIAAGARRGHELRRARLAAQQNSSSEESAGTGAL